MRISQLTKKISGLPTNALNEELWFLREQGE